MGEKKKNLNVKRVSLILLVLFILIVSGLTISSKILNDKASTYAGPSPSYYSSRTILQTSDSKIESDLKNKKLDYQKVGRDTYIINYSNVESAQKAYKKYKSKDGILANEDTIFITAGIGTSKLNSNINHLEKLPEGMTLREYADSIGKKIVAVIDTGVSDDYATASKNFTEDEDEDKSGHGTMVAQNIIENSGDNAIILSLKAISDNGVGYMSNVMQAIQYARDQHVDVINMSIITDANEENGVFKFLIEDTLKDGIQIVAAAGNLQADVKDYYPAGIDGVISVGAMDENNTKLESSNFNATYYEKADSSSQATAIFTGKLISGTDLNGEVTKDTVTIAKDNEIKKNKSLISKNDKGEFEVQNSQQKVAIYFQGTNTARRGYPARLHCLPFDQAHGGDGNKIREFSSDAHVDLGSSGYREYFVIGEVFNVVPGYYIEYEVVNGGHYGSGLEAQYNHVYTVDYAPSGGIGSAQRYYPVPGGAEMSVYVAVKPHSYNLTLNPMGGTFTGSSTNWGKDINTTNNHTVTVIMDNGSYNMLGVASKNNYEFLGWFTDPNGGEQVYDAGGGAVKGNYWTDNHQAGLWHHAGNVTLYAHWKVKNSTITFDANGGTVDGKGSTSSTGQIGTTIWKTPSHSSHSVKFMDGNTDCGTKYAPVNFNGWSLVSGNATTNWNGVTYGTQNSTVKANWSNGQISGVPSRSATGWDFKGWKMGNTWVSNGTTINESGTAYAQWQVHHYTIKYDGSGNQQGSTRPSGSTESQTLAYNDTGHIQNNGFSKTGYTFTGWNTKKDGSGTSYSPGQSVQGLSANDGAVITLYAQWRPNTYKIVFDSNGDRNVRYNNSNRSNQSEAPTSEVNQYASQSNIMSQQNQTYDNATNLPSNKYTWAGHTFLGWSTDKNATSATWANGEKVGTSKGTEKGLTATDGATVRLYAIWKADSHTVTIDPGNGTWNGASTKTKGEDANHTDGKSNTKWGDKVILGDATPADKSATVTYNVNADDASIDHTSDTVKWIFSRWKQNKDANGILYNNTQNSNDGTNGYTQKYYIIQDTNDTVTAVYYFQTINLPTPVRDGYTFLGWYEDEALTKKASRGGNGNGGSLYRPESDITLYARWQKNNYSYTDNEQIFMQDMKNPNGDAPEVKLRKVDANTGEPLTSVENTGFIIGVYKDSVSSSNLVLKLDTANGVYRANGDKVLNTSDADADGWYNITSYLEKNANYVVHEIDAAPGYKLTEDQTFTFNGKTRIQISMEDEKITPPNIKDSNYFIKEDKYGRPIANATFRLKDETTGKTIRDFTTDSKGSFPKEADKSGKKTKTMYDYCIVGHRYSLTETKAPEGFDKVDTIYFEIKNEDDEINPIYAEEKVQTLSSLKIKKVDHDDNPLEGAIFQLYMKNGDGELVPCYMNSATGEWVDATEATDDIVPMTASTGKDGIATFNKIPLRASFTGTEPDFTKFYYLKEIKAPEGFNLLTDIFEIRLSENNVNSSEIYTVKDDTVTLTLETGGNGITPYLTAGFMLMAFSICLAIKKKRVTAICG